MQELRSKLWMVEPYPTGMKAIPQPIAGTAFFPGGTGIWKEVGVRESRSLRRPILVLGHDFDSEVAFRTSLEIGDETYGPTLRNFRRWFDDAGIQGIFLSVSHASPAFPEKFRANFMIDT